MRIFLLVTLLCAVAIAWPQEAPAEEVPAGGRAWELVTQPLADNTLILNVQAVRDDGQRLIYQALGSMPGSSSGDLVSHVRGIRTDSGWRIEPIGGTYEIPRFEESAFFSPKLWTVNPDFSRAILSYAAPMLPSGPPAPRVGVYQWAESGLSFAADMGNGGEVVDTSSDLSRVIAVASEHILPSDAGRTTGVSVYMAEGSTVTQVDVDTSGALLSACGSLVYPAGVSATAERVYFANPAESGPCGPSRLFLRESDGTTTEVSASQCTGGGCDGAQDVAFTGASQDGAVAYLVTAQRLTNADQNLKRDLYRFEAKSGALELVSPGTPGMEGEVTTDLALTSDDGSLAYFYAKGPLLPGQGTAGSNLYVASQSGIRFVGPALPGDPIKISSDGRFAALSTSASLDPADTDERIDTFLYDYEKEVFFFVSNGLTGGSGPFDATILSSLQVSFPPPVRQPLSSDGSRVFFETAEPLVSEDHNEVLDVYEWHAGGLGLISSGKSPYPSRFGGAGSDGETVVFQTAETLLPRDRDGGDLDLYVARPGGGFAEEEPDTSCDEACSPRALTPISRPLAASSAAKQTRKGRIRLRPVAAGTCLDLLHNGRATIAATVPAPGRVSAVAKGRVNGKSRTVLRGVAGAVRPGPLTVPLVATASGRAELRAGHRLRVRLVLRQVSNTLVRNVSFGCGVRG